MMRGIRLAGRPVDPAARVRILLLSTVVLALLGVVGYALQRELTRQQATTPVATAVINEPVRALTGEEQDYAAALWPIHSEVKLSAVAMSFAGIAYKLGEQNGPTLEARVQPLADSFGAAMMRARALRVPPSMVPLHERYLAALAQYENAAAEMVSATRDGKDAHLLAGQQMSLRATEDILRIGDVLWPGEYKPH
jgi:hypothetical protein